MSTINNLRSDEEMYFTWYLTELKNMGYIIDFSYESKKYILARSVKHKVHRVLVTKTHEEEVVLTNRWSYIPDFKIKWHKRAENIFYINLGDEWSRISYRECPFIAQEGICIVEVKGEFNDNNMIREFGHKKKIVLTQYGDYVCLVKPKTLFKKSFTPQRYLLTNVSGARRKINWPIVSSQEFINHRLDSNKEIKRRLILQNK